jgi:hypothetical protein
VKKLLVCASLLAFSAFAAEWKGAISEEHCGAKHVDGSAGAQKCVTACVKGKNAAPVFVTDGKVVKIAEASKAKVMDHLGHKVIVTGKLDGDTVTIDDIKMDK